jgi:hypothetical protein
MTRINNKFAVISATLAAAVADDATFDVAYPTGYSQLSFQKGLARTSGYMVVNHNDRWSQADPGFSVSYGASAITVTNLTGASLAAGATIEMYLEVADGTSRIPLTIPLAPLAGITAADVVTEMYPGIEGTIEYWEFVNTVAVTTAAKAATLNLEIGTTNVTGSIALTSANLATKGVVIGADCTANNTLTRESKLSVEAASVTAFVEGEGFLVIYIRPNQNDVY